MHKIRLGAFACRPGTIQNRPRSPETYREGFQPGIEAGVEPARNSLRREGGFAQDFLRLHQEIPSIWIAWKMDSGSPMLGIIQSSADPHLLPNF